MMAPPTWLTGKATGSISLPSWSSGTAYVSALCTALCCNTAILSLQALHALFFVAACVCLALDTEFQRGYAVAVLQFLMAVVSTTTAFTLKDHGFTSRDNRLDMEYSPGRADVCPMHRPTSHVEQRPSLGNVLDWLLFQFVVLVVLAALSIVALADSDTGTEWQGAADVHHVSSAQSERGNPGCGSVAIDLAVAIAVMLICCCVMLLYCLPLSLACAAFLSAELVLAVCLLPQVYGLLSGWSPRNGNWSLRRQRPTYCSCM